MRKDEIYSWRVSTEMKVALERAARAQGKSIAQLLEELVASWLNKASGSPEDDEEQRRLHQSASRWLGKLRGQDPFASGRYSRIFQVPCAVPAVRCGKGTSGV